MVLPKYQKMKSTCRYDERNRTPDDKPRLLYLSTHPFDNVYAWSGSNRRIYDALKEVPGYRVDYYCAKPNAFLRFAVRCAGFFYRTLTSRALQTGLEERYYGSICRRTLRYLSKHSYDGIVCWQICFGGVFKRYSGRKIFYSDSTYHLMVPYYEWNVEPKQFARVDESQKELLKNCDQFWCFSSYFIRDAVEYYGIDEKRIALFRFFPTTCGTGVSASSSDSIQLLLVGTRYEEKGVPIAIETTRLLQEKYHLKAHLDVVGVDRHGNEDAHVVTFHGKVDQFNENEKFSAFFERADIFILPTQHECAGIVFAEAASFGIPSVSYATGGVPDHVRDGVSGYLLPEGSTPADFAKLIAEKLATKEQRRNIGGTAFQFYEESLSRKSFVQNAKEYLDLLFYTEKQPAS